MDSNRLGPHSKDRMAIFQAGDNQVYRSVGSEYFRDNFEPNLNSLLAGVDNLQEKLEEVRCVQGRWRLRERRLNRAG